MSVGDLASVEVGGLRIAYRRTGSGAPLIVLHGILSDSRAWIPQLAGLAGELDVIAWDAPGAGGSDDPPDDYGADGYANALAGLMDRLGVDSPHILGLSWGGILAQEFYARHPERVRSLILADTYAGWRGSLPAEVSEARLAQVLREIEQPIEDWASDWLPGLLSDAAPESLREEVYELMLDYHPAGYRAMMLALGRSDTREVLPGIAVPTLLVWGDHDARSPVPVAEALHAAIPGAELVVIPGAGHESNLEAPQAFNEAVLRFCSAAPDAPFSER